MTGKFMDIKVDNSVFNLLKAAAVRVMKAKVVEIPGPCDQVIKETAPVSCNSECHINDQGYITFSDSK